VNTPQLTPRLSINVQGVAHQKTCANMHAPRKSESMMMEFLQADELSSPAEIRIDPPDEGESSACGGGSRSRHSERTR